MNKLRYGWWRSLVFWAGIPVMGFVVWAWWDSLKAGTYVGNNPRLMLLNEWSVVKVQHENARGVVGEWGMVRDEHPEDPTDTIETNFELPRIDSVETIAGRRIIIRVSHVWLLLVVAAVWTACFLLRWKRLRRAVVSEGGVR
jgi:hypothetical protein